MICYRQNWVEVHECSDRVSALSWFRGSYNQSSGTHHLSILWKRFYPCTSSLSFEFVWGPLLRWNVLMFAIGIRIKIRFRFFLQRKPIYVYTSNRMVRHHSGRSRWFVSELIHCRFVSMESESNRVRLHTTDDGPHSLWFIHILWKKFWIWIWIQIPIQMPITNIIGLYHWFHLRFLLNILQPFQYSVTAIQSAVSEKIIINK